MSLRLRLHVSFPMVISMVDVGEKTGDMPQMLEKIADTYDEEVDRAVESMTSLIEPVMIVFLAVIVGSIVIAMFLPLIRMIETIDETVPSSWPRGKFRSQIIRLYASCVA